MAHVLQGPPRGLCHKMAYGNLWQPEQEEQGWEGPLSSAGGGKGGSMSGVWHRTSSSKPKWSHGPFAPQLLALPMHPITPASVGPEGWHCRPPHP